MKIYINTYKDANGTPMEIAKLVITNEFTGEERSYSCFLKTGAVKGGSHILKYGELRINHPRKKGSAL